MNAKQGALALKYVRTLTEVIHVSVTLVTDWLKMEARAMV